MMIGNKKYFEKRSVLGLLRKHLPWSTYFLTNPCFFKYDIYCLLSTKRYILFASQEYVTSYQGVICDGTDLHVGDHVHEEGEGHQDGDLQSHLHQLSELKRIVSRLFLLYPALKTEKINRCCCFTPRLMFIIQVKITYFVVLASAFSS